MRCARLTDRMDARIDLREPEGMDDFAAARTRMGCSFRKSGVCMSYRFCMSSRYRFGEGAVITAALCYIAILALRRRESL